MSDVETLKKLLTEAVEQSDDIVGLFQVEDTDFSFELTDGRFIALMFDENLGRLMFMMELGIPPVGRLLEVFSALMSYNAMWRETGGVYTASSGPEEPVLLMLDLFIFGLSADQIIEISKNFAGKAAVLAEFVTAATAATRTEGRAEELLLRI